MTNDRWSIADGAMSDFLDELARSPARMRKVRSEARNVVPPADQVARERQDETENLTRFLRGQLGIEILPWQKRWADAILGGRSIRG